MHIHTHLSLVDGKYAHAPNMVLVPANRKTFPVDLIMKIECENTFVAGAPDKTDAGQWCVLDGDMRQVQLGGRVKRAKSRRMDPQVSRTIMGGGAPNPIKLKVELEGPKLKQGATYTLIYRSFGLTGTLDFVAVLEPRSKVLRKTSGRKRSAAKKASRARKVKAKAKAKKKAVKKKVKKKAAAKKKTVKRKAKAKAKTVKKKVAKKAKSKAKTVKKKAKSKAKTLKRKVKKKARAAAGKAKAKKKR